MQELLVSLTQLVAAFLLSTIAMYLAFFLFQWLTRSLDEWQALREGNAAVGIVLGALLVSVAIMLRPAVRLDATGWDVGHSMLAYALLVEALQMAVGLILAVATVFTAFLAFITLTRGLDEISALQDGNLAVACLLAGLLLAVGILVGQAIEPAMRLIAQFLL